MNISRRVVGFQTLSVDANEQNRWKAEMDSEHSKTLEQTHVVVDTVYSISNPNLES